MTFHLTKNAYNPCRNQRVKLTEEERELLYGNRAVLPAYDYDPVDHQWTTIPWQAFEAQFELLCKRLQTIAKDPALYTTTNKSLLLKVNPYKSSYLTLIQRLSDDIRFYGTKKIASQYASGIGYDKDGKAIDKPGKPVFFAEFKSALEVILLDLIQKIDKINKGLADETDKIDALSRLHGVVLEASVCNEGAHEKLMSMKEEIEKNMSTRAKVAQKLNATFDEMGADHCKMAFKRLEMSLSDLGITRSQIDQYMSHWPSHALRLQEGELKNFLEDWWNLIGSEIHAPSFFKNLAYLIGKIPKESGYVPYTRVPALRVVQEGGADVIRMVSPGNNALKLHDVDVQEFETKLDRLFNAFSVTNFVSDNLFTEIVTPYRNMIRKNLSDVSKHKEYMNDLVENLNELMARLGLKQMQGLFYDEQHFYDNKRISQKDYNELCENGTINGIVIDDAKFKTSYLIKPDCEVNYWCLVLSLKSLETDGFATGVERKKIQIGGSREIYASEALGQLWFEQENGELIYPDQAVDEWSEAELETLINSYQCFEFLTSMRGSLKHAEKYPRLLYQCELYASLSETDYNLKQIGRNNPHFTFESIEDLDHFMQQLEQENSQLFPVFLHSLQASSRHRMNTLFVAAVSDSSKSRMRLLLKRVLNKLEDIHQNLPVESSCPSSIIYLSRELMDACFKLSPEEARDALPNSWFGYGVLKLTNHFFAIRDYVSLLNFRPMRLSLETLFEQYPPMIQKILTGVPQDKVPLFISHVFDAIQSLKKKGERNNLVKELLSLCVNPLKLLIVDFDAFESFLMNMATFDPPYSGNINYAMLQANVSNLTPGNFLKYFREKATQSNYNLEEKTISLAHLYLEYAKQYLSKTPHYARGMSELFAFILELLNVDNRAKKPIVKHFLSITALMPDQSEIKNRIIRYFPQIKTFVLYQLLGKFLKQMDVIDPDFAPGVRRQLKLQYNLDQCRMEKEDRSDLCIESAEDIIALTDSVNIYRLSSILCEEGEGVQHSLHSGLMHADKKMRKFSRDMVDAMDQNRSTIKKPHWKDLGFCYKIINDKHLSLLDKIERLPNAWKVVLSKGELANLLNDDVSMISEFCSDQKTFNHAISDDSRRLRALLAASRSEQEVKIFIALGFVWVHYHDGVHGLLGLALEPRINSLDKLYDYTEILRATLIGVRSDTFNAAVKNFLVNLSSRLRTSINLSDFIDDLCAKKRSQDVAFAILCWLFLDKERSKVTTRERFILVTNINMDSSVQKTLLQKLDGFNRCPGNFEIDFNPLITDVVEELLVLFSQKQSTPTQILQDWGVIGKESSADLFFPENQEPIQTLYWLRVFVCKKLLSNYTVEFYNKISLVTVKYPSQGAFQWVVDFEQHLLHPNRLHEILSASSKLKNDLGIFSVIFPNRTTSNAEFQRLINDQKYQSNCANIECETKTQEASLVFDNLDDLEKMLGFDSAIKSINRQCEHKNSSVFNQVSNILSEGLKDPMSRSQTNAILKKLTGLSSPSHTYLSEEFLYELVSMDDREEAKARMPDRFFMGPITRYNFLKFRNYCSISKEDNPKIILTYLLLISPLMVKKYLTDVPEDKLDTAYAVVFSLWHQWNHRPEIKSFLHEQLKTYLRSMDRVGKVFHLALGVPGFDIQTLASLAFEKNLDYFTPEKIMGHQAMSHYERHIVLFIFFERKLINDNDSTKTFSNPDIIERILTEIDFTFWPAVLNQPDFNFEFLANLGQSRAKIPTIFNAYKQGKPFAEKFNAVAGSGSPAPHIMMELQKLCDNHVINQQELPGIKMLFAQHFARLYSESRTGEAFLNNPANKAIFSVAKNK